MGQLTLRTNVVFDQMADTIDRAQEMPAALVMLATLMEDLALTHYDIIVQCSVGKDAESGLFRMSVFEENGKVPENDENVHKLWGELAEMAREIRGEKNDAPVIEFDTEEGMLIMEMPELGADVLSELSDNKGWGLRNPHVCYRGGYRYSLMDIYQMIFKDDPDRRLPMPEFRVQ